jgi:hypothetical protein
VARADRSRPASNHRASAPSWEAGKLA